MEPQVLVFFVSIGLIGAAFFLFHRHLRDAPLKRRLHPLLLGLAGVVFILFVLWAGVPTASLIVLVPGVVVVTLLGSKWVRFCDRCGATVQGLGPGNEGRRCWRCGTRVD